MKITPLDIRRKEFKRSVRGYSDEEVDIFLDEVADEFERLFQENMELQDKMHRLDEQIAGHTQLREALEKTLVSAQLQAEELRANAHKERELILRDAEMKARDIVSDSYGETQKTQQALVQLKMLEEDFRFKFRSLLEGYLRLLSQAPLAPEAAAAAAAEGGAAEGGAPSVAPLPEALPETPPPVASAGATPGGTAPATEPAPPVPVPPVAAPPVWTPSAAAPLMEPVPAAAPAPAAPPMAAPVSPESAAPAPAAPSVSASVSAYPSARPATPAAPAAPPTTPPPARQQSLVEDETPTEESAFAQPSILTPGYYAGSQQEPNAEATVEANTFESFLGERPSSKPEAPDDEPLRRFFFGRQTEDVDDTFQAEDAAKKDKSREFEW